MDRSDKLGKDLRILNLAFYRFVPLENLVGKRSELKEICSRLNLKGTLLLAPEGINGFIAGEEGNVRQFQKVLTQDPVFADLVFKESFSEKIPFQRMRVKIKKEIIPVRDTKVQPGIWTAPYLSPQDLKQWIEEKKDFNLLDTRNTYEIEYGTFRGAKDLKIDRFQEFPEKLEKLKEAVDWKDRPLVMFCTGGIRCEKASVIAVQAGFSKVYQLDGGILRYFEECGDSHYDGACFVFDERVALNPDLKPSIK